MLVLLKDQVSANNSKVELKVKEANHTVTMHPPGKTTAPRGMSSVSRVVDELH